MVSHNSLESLKCSHKIKNILDIDCKKKFLKYNPEYEGTAITQNQVLTFLLKQLYQDEWIKFDDNGIKSDST